MNLKNKDIYNLAIQLNEEFEKCEIMIPVKINFFLQKNIQILTSLAQEIDAMKIQIAQHYGVMNEQGNYDILPENLNICNKEIKDLFEIEQKVDIHIFKLNDFNDLQLTYSQMNAIMFMIEED